MPYTITTVSRAVKPGRSLTPVPDDVAASLDALAADLDQTPERITIARLDSEQERDRFIAHLRTWADARSVRVRKVKGTDEPTSYAFRLYKSAS